jgi:hypothetical protein
VYRPFTRNIYAKAYIFGHANAGSQHIKQPWVAGRMSGYKSDDLIPGCLLFFIQHLFPRICPGEKKINPASAGLG